MFAVAAPYSLPQEGKGQHGVQGEAQILSETLHVAALEKNKQMSICLPLAIDTTRLKLALLIAAFSLI